MKRILMQTTAILAALNIISGSVRAETAAVTNWSGVYFGIGGRYSAVPSSPTLSFADSLDEIDGTSGIIPYADPEPYIAGADLAGLLAGSSKMGFDLSFGVDRQVGDWVNGLRIDLSTGIEGTAFNIDQGGTYTTTTLGTSAVSSTVTYVSTSFSTSFSYDTISQGESTYYSTTTVTSQYSVTSGTTTNITYVSSTPTSTSTNFTTDTTSSVSSVGTSDFYSTSFTTTTGTTYPEWASNISGRAEVDWMTSANFRSGITSGRNLFYGLAGVAVAQVTTSAEATLTIAGGEAQTVASVDKQDVLIGYSLGLGIEHMLGDANRSSLYAEYRYTDLGSVKVDLAGPLGVSGTFEQDFTSQNIAFGWRFRF